MQLHRRNRFTLSTIGLVLAASALLLTACGNTPAAAQVDTPAAREGRAALAQLRKARKAQPNWPQWFRQLNLADVAYELRSGDRAEPVALEAALKELRGDSVKQFKEADFTRLANALAARLAEMTPVAEADWPAACRATAARYEPITADQIAEARKAFKKRLDDVERRVPGLRRGETPWSAFLFWPEALSLAESGSTDGAMLDRLESRWRGAMIVWDGPEMIEGALAMQTYIQLLRGQATQESQADYEAAWNQLAQLVEARDKTPPGDVAAIATAIKERERLGQASPLTASIRRAITRPNVIFEASKEWLESTLSENVDETYKINDVYAGARSIGSGRLTGTMKCQVLPSTAVGQFVFHLDGVTHSRTQGGSEGVTVSSRSTSNVKGSKAFFADGSGLSTEPAKASATASIVYDSVNAPGRRRRQSEAINQTYARKPQAEREAADATRREMALELDKEGKDLIEQFNKAYHSTLRDRPLDKLTMAPEVRIRSGDRIRFEYRAEDAQAFYVPPPMPEFEKADLMMSFTGNALEEQSLGALAGKTLDSEEIQKAISNLFGSSEEPPKAGLDFRAQFAPHPCDIQLADGQLRARLHILKFDSADVQYPAMTVDMEYNVLERGGDLAIVRQGGVRVKPVAADGESATTVSGRQQTLRLAVQRKMNKALNEEFLWRGVDLSQPDQKQKSRMRVARVQTGGGWMQIALMKDKPAEPQEEAPATASK